MELSNVLINVLIGLYLPITSIKYVSSSTFVDDYNSNSNLTSFMVSDFGDLLVSMLTTYENELNYTESNDYGYDYYDYCISFNKTDYYINLNISLNQLKDHYLAYIQTSINLEQSKTYYETSYYLTSYYYNETSSNYTFKLESNQSWSDLNLTNAFIFTTFSDWTDEDLTNAACFPDGTGICSTDFDFNIDSNNISNGRINISDVNSLEYNVPTELTSNQCGDVFDQLTYGNCGAWASSNQFMCNYNQAYGTSTLFIPPCYASVCYTGCGTTACGFWPNCLVANFFFHGLCPYDASFWPYPDCLNMIGCPTCTSIQRSLSYGILDAGSYPQNFLAANRLASQNVAMVFSVLTGPLFNGLTFEQASVPITPILLCGGIGKTGLHAMTVIGTTTHWDPTYGTLYVKNSWGTQWGANGHFYLSESAYTYCMNHGNIHVGDTNYHFAYNSFVTVQDQDSTDSTDNNGNTSTGNTDTEDDDTDAGIYYYYSSCRLMVDITIIYVVYFVLFLI